MNEHDERALAVPVVPGGELAAEGDPRSALYMQTLNEAQVDFLLQRTPAHEIKRREGKGGMQFSYVEHGYVTERLNLVFGFNWDFEVTDKQILEEEVLVEARLTVRTPAGQTIVKTQFGGADIKRHASGPKSGRPLSIADDYKAAASDALKKCASLLGIGLDLYGRDRPYDVGDGGGEPSGRRARGQGKAEGRAPRVVDESEADERKRLAVEIRAYLQELGVADDWQRELHGIQLAGKSSADVDIEELRRYSKRVRGFKNAESVRGFVNRALEANTARREAKRGSDAA